MKCHQNDNCAYKSSSHTFLLCQILSRYGKSRQNWTEIKISYLAYIKILLDSLSSAVLFISIGHLVPMILGVQISGNFAPGYPELFFEWVPGTRIFVMFPKITLKRASRHPGSGTCWHTSMNSLDLLCSMFEQCRINFRKSQTYRINFGNPSIYEIKCIFCTIKFNIHEVQKYIYSYWLHNFCRRRNKQNFTPFENIQKRSLFSKGKVPEWSTNVKGFWKGPKLPQNIWGNLGSWLFSNE